MEQVSEQATVSELHSGAHKRWILARVLIGLVAVLSVVGAFVGAAVLDRVAETYRIALGLTRDSAKAAADAAGSAVEIADGVVDLAEAANGSIDAAQDVLGSAATASDSIAAALSTNVADSVDAAVSVSNRLASFIEAVERFIPGNRPSIAEDLRQFAAGIEPIPDQLRELGTQLTATADEVEATAASLDAIMVSLDATAVEIDAAKADIENATALAQQISEQADEQLDSSDRTFLLAKVLLFLLAVVIVIGCIAAERAISATQKRAAAAV
jgi:methyl-accepting chemotaxis protein